MPPKVKRPKRDSDVVYTERDDSRASGLDDENDFEESSGVATEADFEKRYTFTTLSKSIRIKYNRATPKILIDTPFPFMKLPPEIRNMIYRYLVVSKNAKRISLGNSRYFEKGSIQTAVLSTNHQILNEARTIMYEDNKFKGTYSSWMAGISLRQDNRQTAHSTARSLRSGRVVDMMKHKGLVYSNIAISLQDVHIEVEMFDRHHSCDMHTYFAAFRCQYHLRGLISLLESRRSVRDPKPWKVTIKGFEVPLWDRAGTARASCSTVNKKALAPLLSVSCRKLLEQRLVEIHVDGKFARGTKKLFRYFEGLPGLNTTKMSKLEDDKVRKVGVSAWDLQDVANDLPVEYWISHIGIDVMDSPDDHRKLRQQVALFFGI